MSATPELIVSYPAKQAWEPYVIVRWINCTESHLKEAGQVAVGLDNGAVFLASINQKIEVGDKVQITQVRFARPGHIGTHPTMVVRRIE